jgi:hypothetical protein
MLYGIRFVDMPIEARNDLALGLNRWATLTQRDPDSGE